MPSKRRADKRRPPLTLEAWEFPFTAGSDFFGTLDPLGLTEPHLLPPGSDARALAQAAWDDVIRDAWAQHGGAFMALWRPRPGLETPWAAVKFGPPSAS